MHQARTFDDLEHLEAELKLLEQVFCQNQRQEVMQVLNRNGGEE